MEQNLKTNSLLLQSLKITAELRTALHILSLPIEELSEFVINEIEKNPLFDLCFSRKSSSFEELSDQNTYTPNSYENLTNQAQLIFDSKEDLYLASLLIGSINERGYLVLPIEKLAEDFRIKSKKLREVQQTIQKMDPIGITSENPREFLLYQLEEKNLQATLSYKILEDHYQDFIYQRYSQISKRLKISQKNLQEEIEKNIKRLKLQPLISSFSEKPIWVKADIRVVEKDSILKILIDDEGVYPVNVSSKYEHLLTSNTLKTHEKSLLIKSLSSGNWLIKNLQMRKNTLFEIAKYLIKNQKDFFLEGRKPNTVTIKDVAKALNLNSSTISRAVQNKFIETPFGLFPLKFFFTHTYKKKSSQSSTLLELEKIITDEDKTKPLTDQDICEKLLYQGIKISRRCVTKYRKKLSIFSAKKRRKYN